MESTDYLLRSSNEHDSLLYEELKKKLKAGYKLVYEFRTNDSFKESWEHETGLVINITTIF